MRQIVLLFVMMVIVSACSENEPVDTRSAIEKPKNDKKVVLNEYQDQIKKAKLTEKDIIKKAKQQKKAIDEATGKK